MRPFSRTWLDADRKTNGRFRVDVIVTDVPEWEEFVTNHPSSTPYHLPSYVGALEKVYGVRSRCLGAWEGNRLVGLLPLVLCPAFPFGRQLTTLPYSGSYGGLCTSSPEVDKVLVSKAAQLAEEEQVLFVELREAEGRLSGVEKRGLYANFTLELDSSAGNVWKKKLSSKVRNQVRKAEKCGLTFQIGGAENLSAFYDIYSQTIRELGSAGHGLAFFRALLEIFPGNSRIALVKLHGRPIATLWLFLYREKAFNPWAGYRKEFRHFCPNNLSYWGAIQWAVAQGCKAFDFGRSVRDSSQARFKRQWGAEEIPLSYYYHLYKSHGIPEIHPRNRKLRLLTALWRVLPRPMTASLGHRLVRRIP